LDRERFNFLFIFLDLKLNELISKEGCDLEIEKAIPKVNVIDGDAKEA